MSAYDVFRYHGAIDVFRPFLPVTLRRLLEEPPKARTKGEGVVRNLLRNVSEGNPPAIRILIRLLTPNRPVSRNRRLLQKLKKRK
jgi:hypothetical protein